MGNCETISHLQSKGYRFSGTEAKEIEIGIPKWEASWNRLEFPSFLHTSSEEQNVHGDAGEEYDSRSVVNAGSRAGQLYVSVVVLLLISITII